MKYQYLLALLGILLFIDPIVTIPTPYPTVAEEQADPVLCSFILNHYGKEWYLGDGACDYGSTYTYTYNGYGGTTTINDALCGYDSGDCCMATNNNLNTDENCKDPLYTTTTTSSTSTSSTTKSPTTTIITQAPSTSVSTTNTLKLSGMACVIQIFLDNSCTHDGYNIELIINGNDGNKVLTDGSTCNYNECRPLSYSDHVEVNVYTTAGSSYCFSGIQDINSLAVGLNIYRIYCGEHDIDIYVQFTANTANNAKITQCSTVLSFAVILCSFVIFF